MSEDQMTLGEFVKYMATLLNKNATPMLFKDESRWHSVLYRLREEKLDDRPEFLDQLIFDSGGPFPKCKDLSRYLQLLHVTGCVGTTNPSYEKMVLKEGLAKLWSTQMEKIPDAQRRFMDHAAALAHEEFAMAG